MFWGETLRGDNFLFPFSTPFGRLAYSNAGLAAVRPAAGRAGAGAQVDVDGTNFTRARTATGTRARGTATAVQVDDPMMAYTLKLMAHSISCGLSAIPLRSALCGDMHPTVPLRSLAYV